MLFSGHENEMAALETAVSLASEYKAHLDVWHITPDPADTILSYAIVGSGIGYLPEEAIADIEKANEDNLHAARKRYLNAIEKGGLSDTECPPAFNTPSASFHYKKGDAAEILSVVGRVSDLVILARLSESEDGRMAHAIENVIFQSGRPLLLVPPAKTAKKKSGNILIAWNGSAEASTAVAFSMPYLRNNSVRIITQQVKGAPDPVLMPSALAHYLKRHAIDAESGVCWNEDMDLPACIIDAAKFDDADMIVMGAYSHTRFRELVLGGVTRFMLKHSDYPVFIAR
jgi:nucleotide-binding universal stress UspA family protein